MFNKPVIDNSEILAMKWNLPKNARITLKENKTATWAKNCIWWNIGYRWMNWSAYYDPDDTLGVVGEPYFEIIFEDAERFLVKDKELMFQRIQEECNKHDIVIDKYPEYFL